MPKTNISVPTMTFAKRTTPHMSETCTLWIDRTADDDSKNVCGAEFINRVHLQDKPICWSCHHINVLHFTV